MANDLDPIAQTVHEAMRAWAKANGQNDLPAWGRAPKWMKESTRASVQFVLDHPKAGAGAQHEQWMAQRQEQGWRFAETRDDTLKHHPMLIPFEALPDFEQKKDHLLIAIVKALTS